MIIRGQLEKLVFLTKWVSAIKFKLSDYLDDP